MMPSRGMGDSKRHPKCQKPKVDHPQGRIGIQVHPIQRAGGKVKSRVNEAGNYTKPSHEKSLFLNGSKRVVKVAPRGNGLREKHK
jgi:hypothetical protein